MLCYGCGRDLGVETLFDYCVKKRNISIEDALILCNNNIGLILMKENIFLDPVGKIDHYECPYCHVIWFEEPNIKDGWLKLNIKGYI